MLLYSDIFSLFIHLSTQYYHPILTNTKVLKGIVWYAIEIVTLKCDFNYYTWWKIAKISSTKVVSFPFYM